LTDLRVNCAILGELGQPNLQPRDLNPNLWNKSQKAEISNIKFQEFQDCSTSRRHALPVEMASCYTCRGSDCAKEINVTLCLLRLNLTMIVLVFAGFWVNGMCIKTCLCQNVSVGGRLLDTELSKINGN